MSRLFPVFLKLAGRTVLIVGGGSVAFHKWNTLRGTGARCIVVAPRCHPDFLALSGAEAPRIEQRPYHPDDLRGAGLVFAATDDPAVKGAVFAQSGQAGIPCNVVDDPDHCDFYMPAVTRAGALTVAISTGGSFPGVARAAREVLDALLPADDDDLLAELLALRERLRDGPLDAPARRAALREVIEAFTTAYLRPGAGLPPASGHPPPSTFPGVADA